jgi:hypothetical protein
MLIEVGEPYVLMVECRLYPSVASEVVGGGRRGEEERKKRRIRGLGNK